MPTKPTAQHTPGPWTLQLLDEKHNGYEDWQTFAIRGPENVCIAIVGDVDHYKSERIPVNARLIATAPDLKAELVQAIAESPNSSHVERRRALLAKIEGKRPNDFR